MQHLQRYEEFFCEADPSLPGWHRWGTREAGFFNSAIGPVHIRAVDGKRAEVRLEPSAALGNVSGMLHGGALLGFLDIALYGGSAALDACHVGTSVTVEVSSQFLSPGRLDTPLIAEFEIMRSTRRLLFSRGVVRQEEEAILQYSAIIRKGTERP